MADGKANKLYQGVPMAERRAQRRAALIRAAVAVYGERGYRAATVKSVCDAAGLTERYFYESFPNSEALLVASYETVIDAMLGEMRDAVDGTAPEARAAAVLERYYAMLRREPEGARVFLVEIAGVSAAVDRVSGAALKAFGQLLDEAVNADDAAPASPALLRAGSDGRGDPHRAALDRGRLRGGDRSGDGAGLAALRHAATPLVTSSGQRPRPSVRLRPIGQGFGQLWPADCL